MPRTIQIRDVDDEVYAALARHAADAGTSVPELLRREAARLAARPTMREWLARTGRRAGTTSLPEIIDALDEARGTWPDARR